MGNLVADPKRLWPNGRIPFEFDGTLDRYKPPFDILAPVGPGATNLDADVRRVQSLLNRFPPSDGGPQPRLAVDGKVGPKTIAAIRQFQLAHFGWHDDRVDPGGPTIIELTIDEVDPTRSEAKGIILNAVHQWNKQLANAVKWVRRLRRDPNCIVFRDGPFNRSESVGMSPGQQGVQINIGRAQFLNSKFGGTLEGVIIHEMGHAAGLGHEHQRVDRDRFVRINAANVARPCDFRIAPEPQLGCPFPFTPCVPVGHYDFVSAMHYFSTQAAKDPSQPTIQAIDANGNSIDRRMGSFNGLSAGDQAVLKRAYQAG